MGGESSIIQKYIPLLLAEGFTRSDAENELREQFEAPMYSVWSPFRVHADNNSADPTHGMVPLIENSTPEEFASYVDAIASAAYARRAQRVLRYFPVWSKKFTRDQNIALLQKFSTSAYAESRGYVGLYLDALRHHIGDCAFLQEVAQQLEPMKESLPYKTFNTTSDNAILLVEVKAARYVRGNTGTCPEMEDHFDTALFKRYAGEAVGIRVKGKLIGALKRVGNHSILGLEEVVDGKGNRSVIPGGAYTTDKETKERIATAPALPYANIDLDSINLFPVRFIRPPRAIEKYFWKEIVKVKEKFNCSQ